MGYERASRRALALGRGPSRRRGPGRAWTVPRGVPLRHWVRTLSPVARCEPALVFKLWVVTPVDSRARLALLHSPEGEAALGSLSRFERTIGLRPIERQFAFEGERGARQDRYLQKYGVAGSVYLGAANVVRFYAGCGCLVVMCCWIFAPFVAPVPTVILAGFLIFGLYRTYTASFAGRAWRRKQESESRAE
jgi:hypothetical protein